MAEIKLTGQIEVQRLFGSIAFVPSEGGGGPLQAKTAFPSHSEQVIAPDEDFYGLVSVTVKPVPRVKACETAVASEASNLAITEVNLATWSEAEAYGRITPEWEVVPVEGAAYGFALNSAGYYESQCKGVNNGYAICKVIFRAETAGFVEMRCIQYTEGPNWDYGLVSAVDTMMELSNVRDANAMQITTNNVAAEQIARIPLPAGEHFICVKYRKDSSGDANNDSLQFTFTE